MGWGLPGVRIFAYPSKAAKNLSYPKQINTLVFCDPTPPLLEIQPADQPSPHDLIGKLLDRSLRVARDDVFRYPGPAEPAATSVTGSPQHADEAHVSSSFIILNLANKQIQRGRDTLMLRNSKAGQESHEEGWYKWPFRSQEAPIFPLPMSYPS